MAQFVAHIDNNLTYISYASWESGNKSVTMNLIKYQDKEDNICQKMSLYISIASH